jgi:uncharacterized coiled-coil protein SlyX
MVVPMDDSREQLVELEIKLAFQDRMLRELDALVRGLANRLEATERELGELKKTLQPEPSINEPPPHY